MKQLTSLLIFFLISFAILTQTTTAQRRMFINCENTDQRAEVRFENGNINLIPCPTKSVKINGINIASTAFTLNNLNASSQSLQVGTSGNDFNIVSSANSHIFNLPISNGSNTGLLNAADYLFFTNKQPLDTDLTSIALQSPANSDFLQFIGTAWTKRTPAQVVPTLGTGTANSTTFLRGDGTWATIPASSGTVSSVDLSLPNIFSVTNSPVTTSGTLTGTLASQTANTIFAAPNSTAGTPNFRALVAADIPSLDTAKITSGVFTTARLGTGTANSTNFLRGDGTWSAISANPALIGDVTGNSSSNILSSIRGYPLTIPDGAGLSDDFNDNSLNTTKWTILNPNASITIDEQNNRLEFTVPNTNLGTRNNTLITANSYDFTGKTATIDIVQLAEGASTENLFQLEGIGSNYAFIYYSNDTMIYRFVKDGVTTQIVESPATVPKTATKWRFRHQESNNTINSELFINGYWVTKQSFASPFALTSTKLRINANIWNSAAATVQKFIVDNFLSNLGVESLSSGSVIAYDESILGFSTKTAAQQRANILYTTVPATAATACTTGQQAFDTNNFYICIAANTWKRVAIATF